jgi:hypothetical protein
MSRKLLSLWIIAVTAVSGADAGIVEDWNAAFVEAVRKETPPPCLVSRNFPMLHLAIYRAVLEAEDRKMKLDSQIRVAHLAARESFLLFFPSQKEVALELDGIHMKSAPSPAEFSMALKMVKDVFEEREGDGASTSVHFVPDHAPGQWRRTPPNFRPPEFPHWGNVRPFVLKDVTVFRAPPPPSLDSDEYADELNTVKKMGEKSSPTRTSEQTLVAWFWSDFSYTTSPPGHWNDIARQMSLERSLSLRQSAWLFALLNAALADTCIAVWDTKYHYNYWRPQTAIQRAGEDGNGATKADLNWNSLLPAPPHPEYVSGHSGISGAAAAILEHVFGTDDINFKADSDEVKGVKREFNSFQDCAEEIAMSRVFGGIHFPSAGREGLKMGRNIAGEILKYFHRHPIAN